jgi:hypothetical protein
MREGAPGVALSWAGQPEPAPEPVVVVDDVTEDEEPELPPAEHHAPPAPRKSISYFGF